MWKCASLYGTVLFAAGSHAAAHSKRDGYGPLATSLSVGTTSQDSTIPQAPPQAPQAPQAPSPPIVTILDPGVGTSAISSLPLVAPPHSPVPPGSPPVPVYTNKTSINSTPIIPTVITYVPSGHPTHVSNSTSVHLNSSSTRNGFCTGCVLAAHGPITTSFDPYELYNPWRSTVVTETIVTEFSTYFNNNTIETVVTEERTVNQTKTLTGWDNQLITHTTPNFKVQVTDGVYVTLDAGPTYIIYNNLFGAPDNPVEQHYPGSTRQLCIPTVTSLRSWQPAETATEDWSYFISTHTGGSLHSSTKTDQPYPLPTKLINYLEQDPDIQSQFYGSDLASCSISLDLSFLPQFPPPAAPTAPAEVSAGVPPPLMSPSTGTFLSTTYESTSVHVTVRGCLRCELTDKNNGFDSTPTNKAAEPSPTPADEPDQPDKPPSNEPDGPVANTANPTHGGTQPTPSIPHADTNPDGNDSNDNNPDGNNSNGNKPPAGTNQQPGVTTSRIVTIGGSVFPINNPRPTQSNPGTPNDQDQDDQNAPPPIIIIGSETFKPGETKTVNGVPVVVPTNGGGTRLVVDGSTIAINPAATPGPVLTVGEGTVTANPQGEFVLGTETLTAGGPPITINGNTISLGPSSIAIVNGVTQTIANGPGPTAGPTLTVGGQTVSATVAGGSTVFVVAPGQTLGAGSSLMIDGTTYSMPEDGQGSTIVVNGQTSVLGAGESALTLDGGRPVTPQVVDGTTAYVIAPGQTLTPGGVITISGTTYSMPVDGQGSTLVVNGETSVLSAGETVLTLDGGRPVTPQVIDGTTAYVLGPGQTLTPGGVVTISGTLYSMPEGASGSVVVINGVTTTLSSGAGIIAAPALTINGITYTQSVRDGTTEYVLGEGTTLAPGSTVEMDGTTYSLDESGTALIINGQTSTLPKLPKSTSASTTSSGSTSTRTRDAGDLIASGIGETSKGVGAAVYDTGVDKWLESVIVGTIGWLAVLL
ncbi:hypothetical protein TW65_08238 [Stemphylium lycopersici]|uniref:Uncharacterized protein n=1 Tax=Stemphylium lycopersici TaxID=183478 RepID=A0A364NGE7_STELY|nr:hypothetical protein TW65_08238 [Stemphylium lycopersici]RAR16368.1 hypothetical protein DDE83_000241 [Stemphylium lycopersici]